MARRKPVQGETRPSARKSARLSLALGYTMITAYKGISPQVAETAFVAEGARVIGDVHIGEHSSVWFN